MYNFFYQERQVIFLLLETLKKLQDFVVLLIQSTLEYSGLLSSIPSWQRIMWVTARWQQRRMCGNENVGN